MEARYLILARYAEFTQDGLVNIIGGDNTKIIAEDYPYVHPVVIAAARIVFDRTDCEQEHAFTATIVDAESEDVVADGVSATFPRLVMHADTEFLGTGLILPFRAVIFPKSAIYAVKLSVDGTVAATARFRVAPLAFYQSRAT